mgnify:CR=1 FL=1
MSRAPGSSEQPQSDQRQIDSAFGGARHTEVDALKRAEHRVKHAAFALLRPFLKLGRQPNEPYDGSRLRRFLLLRPESKLGDLAISLPTVDYLKSCFPDAEIGLFCSPGNAILVRDDPRFDRVWLYRKRLFIDLGELRRIRERHYDCIIDLLCDDSVTSLAISQWASKDSPRLGTAKLSFSRYYDATGLTLFDPGRHIIMNTLGILRGLDLDPSRADPYAQPYVDSGRLERADGFIDSIIEPDDRMLVGLNLSAGTISRDWGPEKPVAFIRRLFKSHPAARVVVFSTPSDREKGRRVTGQFKSRVHLIPDRLDILTVAAILRRLSVLVTPDTAVVHIARSYKVPIISLMPGHPRNRSLWAPFGQKRGAVMAATPANIYDISVEQAWSEFLAVAHEFAL